MNQPESRVFIVDDEPSIRKTFQAFLAREGYDIELYENGMHLLTALEKSLPDAILLDVMMPEIDGFEVCRQIKGNPDWQHIPIVLVTALDSREALLKGFDAGADEFLIKPVRGQELRVRIRSMLRTKHYMDELKDNVRMREELTHLIIHDMNNPLAALLMYSELIARQKPDAEKCWEYVSKMQFQGRRLESLVNDMLLEAKIANNKLILNREVVNLNQFVKDTRKNHGDVAKLKDIDFVIETPKDEVFFSVDSNLFRRVIDNLMSNALKFAPPKSKLVIRAESAQDDMDGGKYHARIKVMDEGRGISDRNKKMIFDKFSMADLKKSGASGFGLGLSFCKMAVAAHDGRIYVTDNHPRGSVFIVEV